MNHGSEPGHASQPRFTPKQGQYLAFDPCLYAGAWSAGGRSRLTPPLSSLATFSPSDAGHPRTRRVDPAPARHRAQRPAAYRSQRLTAASTQPKSTRQILRAGVLAESRPLSSGRCTWRSPDGTLADRACPRIKVDAPHVCLESRRIPGFQHQVRIWGQLRLKARPIPPRSCPAQPCQDMEYGPFQHPHFPRPEAHGH